MRGVTSIAAVAAFSAIIALASSVAHASIIWSGPDTTFTRPDGADGTLPANQDALTANVIIARGATQGIYNAASESSYTHFSSPAGTEWAFGTLVNYLSLTYANWETWANGNPPATVGQDAVLHLISDDIYMSVKFTSFGGPGAGGGFAYIRSTPVPEPSVALLAFGMPAIFALRRRRTA